MADCNLAEYKIDKILLSWFIKDPILLNVYCMLGRRADVNQQSIGLDIKSKIPSLIYNPNFVNSVSEQQLEMCLVSEGFKVLLRHCTTRLREPRQISALSSSITISELLETELAQSLGDVPKNIIPESKKFKMKPKLIFEEYYTGLMSDVEEVNKKIKELWDSMPKDMSDDEKIKNLMGESGSQQSAPPTDEDGYNTFEDGNEALKSYFDPNGSNNYGWGVNDLFDVNVQGYIQDKMSSAKGWGKYTGNAMSQIIAANESKISYKEVVRRFNKSTISYSKTPSRMKLNRRYGLDLPGYRSNYTSKIMFAVDVSCSMSDKELAEGFAVINNVCKHAEIYYVQFDTEITSVEKKFKNARDTFKVTGRGGTDFQCVIDLAVAERVDGLVIFTDGDAGAPTRPKMSVLWLMHNKNQNPPVKWGYRAWLKTFEDVHI